MFCCLFSLSKTFRVKRSPKKSPLSDTSQVCLICSLLRFFLTFKVPADFTVSLFAIFLQDPTSADESSSLHQQDDHATDEEKLASSTGHKWAVRHEVDQDLNTDHQDFPQPCDVTTFVNENSLPQENPGLVLLSDFFCLLQAPVFMQDQSVPHSYSYSVKFKALFGYMLM